MFNKFIVIFLTAALSVPVYRTSKADESNRALQIVDLSKPHIIDFFSGYLVDLIKTQQKQDPMTFIHFYHIKDMLADPKLVALVDFLDKEGIAVTSTLVSQSDFYRFVNQSETIALDDHVLRRYLLSYEYMINETPHLILFLQRIKTHLLGIPSEVTLAEHFFKKDDEGHSKRRFSYDRSTTALAAWITLGSAINLSFALYLQGKQFTDQEFMIVNAIVATWVFLFIYFQREIASFKMQGIRVAFKPDLAPDNQVTISRKTFFFTGTSMIQEWILNALILTTVLGLDNITQTHTLNLLLNGFLSAYSYVPAERLKAKLLLSAEKALNKNKPALAQQLNNYAWWIAFFWWNFAFPLMKNAHLLLTGTYQSPSAWMAALPFVAVGSLGYILEGYDDPIKENFVQILRKSWNQQRCNDLLTVVKQ